VESVRLRSTTNVPSRASVSQAKPSSSARDRVAGWTPPPFFKLKRMMLAIAGALANINIWTGAPVLALWVGSQTHEWAGSRAPGTGVSMQSIFIIVVVLAVLEFALIQLATRVSDAYDKLTGRRQARRRSPWLRSLSGERDEAELGKYGISAIERTAIISVVVCVLLLEAWFFFAPRSALPY
jgi:hypothetical protein